MNGCGVSVDIGERSVMATIYSLKEGKIEMEVVERKCTAYREI